MTYISGITLLATNDNLLFPFSTGVLLEYPMNMFINHIEGLGMYYGMKVMKVNVSSLTIQAFILYSTGHTLSPLCFYQDINNINKTNDVSTDSAESSSDNIIINDKVVENVFDDSIKDDIEMQSFVDYLLCEDDVVSLNADDLKDMLDIDKNFMDFDIAINDDFESLTQ